MISKIALGVLAVAVLAGVYFTFLEEDPPAPVMKDGWWGKGSQVKDDDPTLHKFRVSVPDGVLVDLKNRLQNARFAEELDESTFEYGMQTTYLKTVVDHWKTKYDWRKQEKKLNNYDQFKTQIEGIDVHFIYAKSKHNGAKPLLMVHGWPGSVWEFYKILPMLTDPTQHGGTPEDAFDVICPSIPGYGFSEAPHHRGFDNVDAARMFMKLMKRLGHNQFYVQGGDWGAFITRVIAQAYPSMVIGLHTNMIAWPTTGRIGRNTFLQTMLGTVLPSLVVDSSEAWKIYPYMDKLAFILQESGYMHIQATKPDTIGAALVDSPVGTAAYILEKFSTWTNPEWAKRPDGGLAEKYDLDDLLTNVMIYWVTGTITSSCRFYKENFKTDSGWWEWERLPVEVPSGLAGFPNELGMAPRSFAKMAFKNMVQYTDMPTGGHFAAFEEPELLADDIRAFVRKVAQT